MNNHLIRIRTFFDKYLSYIFIALMLATMLTYCSHLKFLQINSTAGLIYRISIMVLIGVMYLIGLLAYRKRYDYPIIILILIFTISSFLALFISPIVKDVAVPLTNTLIGAGVIVSNVLSLLVIFWVHKYYHPDKKSVDIISIFLLCFGIFLALYSYIFQYEAIYNTFQPITPSTGWNADVTSIFIDKTTYGYMLFVCSLFTLIYILRNKKYWMYSFVIFFLLNMFLSRSKTSIVLILIIMVSLFVYHIATSFKQHKRAWIITLLSVGIPLIVLALFILIPPLRIGIFDRLYYFINDVIIHDGIVVMADRFYKWGKLFNAMDHPFIIIFGCGERIANLILTTCGCATTGDSIYISNYGVGGIIKSFLYLALIIFVIRNNVKKTSNNWHKFIIVVFEVVIAFGGLFEDDNLIGVSIASLASIMLFYLTPDLLGYQEDLETVAAPTN